MRKLIVLLCLVALIAFPVTGGDSVSVTVSDVTAANTNTATSAFLGGFLDSIVLLCPTAQTNTLIVTSPYETILTVTATETNTYRPVITVGDVTGVDMSSTTSSAPRRFMLSQERLVATMRTTDAASTNDIIIIYRVDR